MLQHQEIIAQQQGHLKCMYTIWFVTFALCGMAATIIPVPFLNGFVAGCFFFLAWHELIHTVHQCQSAAENRTWKQLLVGTIISGIGWSLGLFAQTSDSSAVKIIGVGFGLIGGLVFGLQLTYLDVLRQYQNIEQETDQTEQETDELNIPIH